MGKDPDLATTLSRNLAPVGCLQYYTGASGEIKSWNYKPDVSATNDPNMLANLNYAICIRVENGYCGIRYSQAQDNIPSSPDDEKKSVP